jgi:hypothetical protein
MSMTATTSVPSYDYLESGDVAHRLRRSAQTIRTLVMTGKLEVAARTFRGVMLFREVDVERLRQEQENQTRQPGRRPVRQPVTAA